MISTRIKPACFISDLSFQFIYQFIRHFLFIYLFIYSSLCYLLLSLLIVNQIWQTNLNLRLSTTSENVQGNLVNGLLISFSRASTQYFERLHNSVFHSQILQDCLHKKFHSSIIQPVEFLCWALLYFDLGPKLS